MGSILFVWGFVLAISALPIFGVGFTESVTNDDGRYANSHLG